MLTTSPNKASMTANRRSPPRYPYLSQKSPQISSPALNQEQSPVRNQQIRGKLQLLLKHNSQLLNQNGQLSQLVNTLRAQIQIRTRRQETEFGKLNNEVVNVASELQIQQQNHERQIRKLIDQISRLHDQIHKGQIQKQKQIRRAQQAHQRQIVYQINQVRRSQDDGKSLMELQLAKLKQTIQLRQFQKQSLQSQLKSQIEQLKSRCNLAQNQIDHQKRIHQIQITQLARRGRQDMRAALKHMELQKNVEIRQIQNRVLKLKKDLNDKQMQAQQLAKQATGDHEQIYLQLSSAKKQKQYLLEEIHNLSSLTSEKIGKQKQRLAQLASLQKQNLQKLFLNEKQSLLSERQKLLRLCDSKGEQIKRLYESLRLTRQTFDKQQQQLKQIIQFLRNSLKKTQKQHFQQSQLLKIKMAQLHQADIEGITSFYQNQIIDLKQTISQLRAGRQRDRQQIYKLLAENDQLRKTFQVQISKQKAKIQDMKVKFAAARLQFKQQITSLGTKMELTSQSLIRQTQQKQRGSEFFQAQKRKFYRLIEDKDRQIQGITESSERARASYTSELAQLKSQINLLRDSLVAKQQQFKELRNNLQAEFQRKSLKFIQQNKAVPDDTLQKQLHQARGKLSEAQKQLFKKQKQCQNLLRQVKSLQQQLGLRAGFIQTMQLQSCAAIEDQKQKFRVLMNKNEVSMKDYYESALQKKKGQTESLQRQLKQKQNDLKQIIIRYSQLQKKLQDLLESQDKLSQFQKKITHLGLDQNLIKNMAQLFNKN